MKTRAIRFFQKEENLLVLLIILAGLAIFALLFPRPQNNFSENPSSGEVTLFEERNPQNFYEGVILFITSDSGDLSAYTPDNTTLETIDDLEIYQQLEIRDSFSADAEWQISSNSDGEGNGLLVAQKTSSDWDRVLLKKSGTIVDPVWSPVSNQIAYIIRSAEKNELRIYDIETEKDLLLIREKNQIGHPSWSPNGKEIVYWQEEKETRQLWVVNSISRKKTKLSLPLADGWNPVWGKSLAISISTNPEESSTEALLGNIQCNNDGSFNASFLVRNIGGEQNTIGKVTLSVENTQVYSSGDIAKLWLSKTLNLFFVGSSQENENAELTLKVWDAKKYHTNPLVVKTEVDCLLTENIPTGLLGALPENMKEKIALPNNTSQDTELPEFTLSDFRNKIIFKSDRGGRSELFVITPDGSSVEKIEKNLLGEYQYRLIVENRTFFSPKNQLVFSKKLLNRQSALFLFDFDSGWAWQLTDYRGNEKTPAWSPDGKRIAYVSESGSKSEISILNIQTRDSYQISPDSEATCNFPSWSPSGEMLTFWCENTSGTRQIWIASLNSNTLLKISSTNANDWDPVWVNEPIPLPEDAGVEN